jgi:hypothetical protein
MWVPSLEKSMVYQLEEAIESAIQGSAAVPARLTT